MDRTDIIINNKNLKIEGVLNVIYKNACDVISMMEVGRYFELEELIEELQLIGVTIEEKTNEIKNKFDLKEEVISILDNIIKKAMFLNSINEETANEKVINKAKEIKCLVKKAIKHLFNL